MNHITIIGIMMMILGIISFNPVYGSGWWRFCKNTPAGDLCYGDSPFTVPFTILFIVIGVGIFLIFYFVSRKTHPKKK